MRTEQLKSFIALYETRSFTAAAERLYTSQPVVTRHISQLEEALGGPLFTRTTRMVNPTKTGTAFYEKVNPAMNLLEEGIAECKALNDGKVRLVIGYEYLFMDHFSTPWLKEFKEQHQDEIAIDIVEEPAPPLFNALFDGRIDCAFIGATGPDIIPAYLETRPIARIDEVIVTSKTHALASRESVTLEDVISEVFAYPPSKPTYRESLVVREFAESGHPQRSTTALHHLSAMKMVEQGIAIVNYPTEYLLDNPNLVKIPYKTKAGNRITFNFVWNRANENDAFLQFKQFIDSKIDEMDA